MASRGVNKVILVGNLGNDPEIRFMPNGGAVANFTLATSESWRDKNTGENKEVTEWHRVVLFGKVAEIAGEYLKKGSQVYIEGQLKTRKWEKDGVERYTTEIVVNVGGTMQMIGGKKQEGGSQQQNRGAPDWDKAQRPSHSGTPQQPQQPQQRQNRPPANHQGTAPNGEPPMDFDDDIPF